MRTIALATLLGFVAIYSARAAEPFPPPSEDMFSYRYTGSREETTSDCIGIPKTPMCVADTYFAAGNYGDDDILWDIAHGKRPGLVTATDIDWYRYHRVCYKLIGAWQFKKHRMPDSNNPWGIEEGDVALSFLTTYFIDGKCGTRFFPDSENSFLMRNGSFGWFVVDSDNRIDFVRNPLSPK